MKVHIDLPFASTDCGQLHNWFTPLKVRAGLADHGIREAPLDEAELLVCYEFNYKKYKDNPLPKVYMYGHDEAAILWETRDIVLHDPTVKFIAVPNYYRDIATQAALHFESTRHGAITYACSSIYERPRSVWIENFVPSVLPPVDFELLRQKVRILGSMMWQHFYGYVVKLDHCETSRPIDVNFLGNSHHYDRWSVRQHRYLGLRAVNNLSPSLCKLVSGSRSFLMESHFESLRQSKICVAPWGCGETTARDFQGVLAGSVVIKPDSRYIQTSPDFYDGSWPTILWCRPDFSDLPQLVDDVITNWDTYWSKLVREQQHRMAAVRATTPMVRKFAQLLKRAL